MNKAVVISEFDEWFGPDFFDLVDFSNDLLDRFQFILRSEKNGTGAETAFVRTTSARLHRDSIVLGRIKEVEARHGRIGQIEKPARLLHVKRLKSAGFGIVQNARPERFAFT